MEQELVASERQPSITELIANKNIVLGAISKAMEEDKDYGVIPGCNKPSLWKPGAEKLLMMFRLCAVPEDIKDLSSSDATRYRITTKIVHAPSGMIVGYGLGEASSDEEKYRWRKATSREEFDNTPEDRRRSKWVQKWSKGQKVYAKGKPVMDELLQVRTNHADLANTILKMADKRSFVGATLKVTAASAVFTQDLEDLNGELREVVVEADAENVAPQKDPIKPPERASKAVHKKTGEIETKDTPSGLANAQAPELPKADPQWKKMTSNRDGDCATCEEGISKGAEIYWDRENFEAHHAEHFAS
jgi:hypothetical protein